MEHSEIPKKIFWWTLFSLFWVVSSIIIGYAFGYRFSPERGVFVYGGSVSMKTTPQESDVYINKVLYSSKKLNRINNSYHIDGIEPGDYFLEVKSPDYETWSKKISVHSGVSTEFWNIVLTRKNYEKTDYDLNGVGRFFISPRKNLTATTSQDENKGFSVDILNAEKKTTENIFMSKEFSFTNDEKENIEWTPQAHRIIIPVIKINNQEKHYFIADVPSEKIIDLKDIAKTEKISNVRWDPKTKNALFYVSEKNLFRVDLDAPDQVKKIAENIASYELASNGLYYLQLPEGIVYKNNTDGTDTPVQITLSAPSKMNNPDYQIIVYDDDRIVFLNTDKNLYIYNKGEKNDYFQELSSDAFGSQFSDDGKKLLFWNEHEINVYFSRKWDVQPVREEGEILPITRYSEKISNVQWSRDYEHIIFSTGKEVKFVEIDQRDHRNLMDLFKLNSDNVQITNNNSDGLIYFTDTNSNGINVLNTVEFPEKTSLLQGFFPGATTTPQKSTAQ
ncbi:MAG: PEGA domain-containing protein [Candidatus Moranbacteria bacterium]|nr:PEGA domain-containing protein [Candidatus Moranbacteria bacterium]